MPRIPLRNFLPSTGRLVRYREPAGGAVRVDSGVYEGAEITIHYDPMIAKLSSPMAGIARAATAALREALDAFVIRGVGHNLPFLAALLAHPRFAARRPLHRLHRRGVSRRAGRAAAERGGS
jgi:propionyl-CoA carboxylase alpha chain